MHAMLNAHMNFRTSFLSLSFIVSVHAMKPYYSNVNVNSDKCCWKLEPKKLALSHGFCFAGKRAIW